MKNEKTIWITETSLPVEELIKGGWNAEGSCHADELGEYVKHVQSQHQTPQQFAFKSVLGSFELFSQPRA